MGESDLGEPLTEPARVALALVVVAASVHFFSVPVADNDLWGHVLFGQRILEHGLPARNDYSYTEPDHPWINHEILAECVLGWSYDRFGAAGVLALKWVAGLAALAVIAVIARRRRASVIAVAAALVLAASLMAWGYHARPQIFTFLFLAILWERIDRAASTSSPAPLWAAPPLFVLWINTHGGVLAGVGILGVAAAAIAIRARDLRTSAPFAVPVAAAVAALLANPYGLGLPAFLVADVLLDRPISEWASIPLFDLSNLQFKIAVAIAFAGFAWSDRRRSLGEAAVIVVATILTFRHERHLPLFAIVTAPHLATVLSRGFAAIGIGDDWLARDRAANGTVALAALALAFAFAFPALRAHTELGFGIQVPRAAYPVEAISFLRSSNLRGNLAVPFGWGEYAIWHLHPAFRVSIDGRYTTAYSEEAIEAGWRYLDGGSGWDAHLEEADVALTDARHVTAKLLRARPDWRLVHADPTASVFVRGDVPVGESPTGARVPPERSLFP